MGLQSQWVTTMPTFEPEDFLAALRRLYEQQVKHDEQISQLTENITQLAEQAMQTDGRLSKLIGVVGDLTAIVRSHEDRLESLEGPA
jgi:hypothetical protein